MDWLVSQRFSSRNAPMEAVQDTRFKLERSGVELKSEARMAVFCGPSRYMGDAPFLVFLRRRDARVPFFAVWVETAELLLRA
jgi:hypothetical protein